MEVETAKKPFPSKFKLQLPPSTSIAQKTGIRKRVDSITRSSYGLLLRRSRCCLQASLREHRSGSYRLRPLEASRRPAGSSRLSAFEVERGLLRYGEKFCMVLWRKSSCGFLIELEDPMLRG